MSNQPCDPVSPPELADLAELREKVRLYALSLPEAYEDFPWGESVAKVNKKVFVFLGRSGNPPEGFGCAVKLPESGQAVLALPFTEPCGYGLGKSGWVSVQFRKAEAPPVEMLQQWIDESWRAVAPKKLVKAHTA